MPLFRKSKVARRIIPDGLWKKCENCNQIIYNKTLTENLQVCPKCNFHFRISAKARLDLLLDAGSFREHDSEMVSLDPLGFKGPRTYKEKLAKDREATGLKEAVITGEGLLNNERIAFGVMDFGFIGASMGSVVGEKITRTTEFATSERIPLIIISASGGARMQEGVLSLMQMAKTSAALARHRRQKLPFLSVLTNPTMAGVMASFASLGDIIIAEPLSLIGFTGPRVIEQTIRQKLPEGFQRSEFLLAHGMVDMIVSRKELKDTLSKLLDFLA